MSAYPVEPLVDIALSDLKWIEGRWKGFVGEDPIEEYWTIPANGAMMGMFRWFKGDRAHLYELILLLSEGSETVMRLKHFSPELFAQEEKDNTLEFVLVEMRDREAVFLQRGVEKAPWLVYRRESPTTLLAWLEQENEPPKVEEIFRYQRF